MALHGSTPDVQWEEPQIFHEGIYAVVVLEFGSDDPGVEAVYAPLAREVADDLAEHLCAEMGVERGREVQVSMIFVDPREDMR